MGPKRKLRVVKETQATEDHAEATRLAQEDCVICYDKMGEDTATLGCSHSFCFKCIDHWRKTENSCPLCKARFASISRLRKVRNKFKKVTVRVAPREQGPPAMYRPPDAGAALFALLFNHLWAHERRMHAAFDDDDEDDEDDEDFIIDNLLGTPANPIYVDLDEIEVAVHRPHRAHHHGIVIDLTNESEEERQMQRPAPRQAPSSSSSTSSSSTSLSASQDAGAPRAPFAVGMPTHPAASSSGPIVLDLDDVEAGHSSTDQQDSSSDLPQEPPRKRLRRS